jgi:hypothetical protein
MANAKEMAKGPGKQGTNSIEAETPRGSVQATPSLRSRSDSPPTPKLGGDQSKPQRRVRIQDSEKSIVSANSKQNLNDQDEPMNEGGSDGPEGKKTQGEADPEDKLEAPAEDDGKFVYEECGPDEPETTLIFQDELNEYYTNPMMAVFYLYAWFFTNLLVFYTYGGAMPFMYALGVIFFGLSYLVWKFLAICFYRKTYGFDEEIPLYSVRLIKFGILFQLCMITFMYTDKRVMTPPDYDEVIHYRPEMLSMAQVYGRRFDTSSNFFILVYALSFCALYCVYRCIVMPIVWFIQANVARKKAKLEEDEEEEVHDPEQLEYALRVAEDFSDDFYKELNIVFLRDLYIRSKKEYELFRTMVNAISYDTAKLSDSYATFMKKNLKMRIQIIEDTVDVHLNVIGGLEMYLDRSYLYKLAVLDLNEEKLKEKDPKCLRMNAMTQSFYVYEQLEY